MPASRARVRSPGPSRRTRCTGRISMPPARRAAGRTVMARQLNENRVSTHASFAASQQAWAAFSASCSRPGRPCRTRRPTSSCHSRPTARNQRAGRCGSRWSCRRWLAGRAPPCCSRRLTADPFCPHADGRGHPRRVVRRASRVVRLARGRPASDGGAARGSSRGARHHDFRVLEARDRLPSGHRGIEGRRGLSGSDALHE